MPYKEAIRVLNGIRDEGGWTNSAYNSLTLAIEALEMRMPKKPYKDNENGVYEKEHCPSCHRSLFPNDHHCECGQAIDWSDDE